MSRTPTIRDADIREKIEEYPIIKDTKGPAILKEMRTKLQSIQDQVAVVDKFENCNSLFQETQLKLLMENFRAT